MKGPELLAPVSELEMLAAAAQGGADAVYLGVGAFTMRQTARNFDEAQLPKVVGRCRELGLRCYLTVNTLVYDEEAGRLERVLDRAAAAGVDAVIAWDPAVVLGARARGLRVHLSTQASVANTAAARFWKAQGVERIILARELDLEQVRRIVADAGVEVETFVHGALCLAVSGRCMLSLYEAGLSCNRGRCTQPCRREYEVRDVETDGRFVVGGHYVLSPKDLCTLPFIDRLIGAGITAFKIEGRNRPPEYVREVVGCYREAISAALAGALDEALVARLLERLERVYHRGLSPGFYLGVPGAEGWAGRTGPATPLQKVFVGRVVNFYQRVMAGEVSLDGRSVARGEEITVIGPTTGVVTQRVDELQIARSPVERAERGSAVAIKARELWRRGDKVFVMEARPPAGA